MFSFFRVWCTTVPTNERLLPTGEYIILAVFNYHQNSSLFNTLSNSSFSTLSLSLPSPSPFYVSRPTGLCKDSLSLLVSFSPSTKPSETTLLPTWNFRPNLLTAILIIVYTICPWIRHYFVNLFPPLSLFMLSPKVSILIFSNLHVLQGMSPTLVGDRCCIHNCRK